MHFRRNNISLYNAKEKEILFSKVLKVTTNIIPENSNNKKEII